MAIDVLLVRARDPGHEATENLARLIAERYGVPADALLARLSAGSFRVKSGTDLETARRYANDLETIGAICELRDSQTGRPLVSPTRDEPAGLAAASGSFSQDLGALGSLALSTLDGHSGDAEPPPLAGEPTREAYNLSTPPAGRPALAAAEPVNAFAPPSSDAPEEELMLAIDPRGPASGYEDVPPPPKTMAPEIDPLAQSIGLGGASAEVASTPAGPSIADRVGGATAAARRGLARRGRGAFVAGVFVALLAGLFAAHVVAVLQEAGAYSPVRKELLVSYAEATDPDSHASLGPLREGAADLIDARQRRIAITSLLVWLLAAGGAAALWFRYVPWERLGSPGTTRHETI